jgi:hypothetical protein
MPSDELYELDENGVGQDARLHAAILGNDQLAPADVERMVAQLVAQGMTREGALALYRVTDWGPEAIAVTASRRG